MVLQVGVVQKTSLKRQQNNEQTKNVLAETAILLS
jgi:hypothetical protein